MFPPTTFFRPRTKLNQYFLNYYFRKTIHVQAFNKTTTLALISSFALQQKSGTLELPQKKGSLHLNTNGLMKSFKRTQAMVQVGWWSFLIYLATKKLAGFSANFAQSTEFLHSDRFLFAQCGNKLEGTLTMALLIIVPLSTILWQFSWWLLQVWFSMDHPVLEVSQGYTARCVKWETLDRRTQSPVILRFMSGPANPDPQTNTLSYPSYWQRSTPGCIHALQPSRQTSPCNGFPGPPCDWPTALHGRLIRMRGSLFFSASICPWLNIALEPYPCPSSRSLLHGQLWSNNWSCCHSSSCVHVSGAWVQTTASPQVSCLSAGYTGAPGGTHQSNNPP